jgi:hypothetical protein
MVCIWSVSLTVCSIQILSRSYAVRYRECYANETLVWQFKPIKKSINWAIWRKTDTAKVPTDLSNPVQNLRRRSTFEGDPVAEERKVNLREKLESIGMEEVVPGGRCEGGQIQKGSHNVLKGGMYALVFGMSYNLVAPDRYFRQHIFNEHFQDGILHFVKSSRFTASIIERARY